MSRPSIPRNKLAKLLPGKTPVVLVACGSYSPITYLHLRVFELARDYFKVHKPDYQVIGGYMSPVGDSYVKKGLVSSNHRIAMCELGVESSDWLMVDPWESSFSEYVRTILVLQHFQLELSPTYEGLKIFFVCGADLLQTFNVKGVWSDQDVEEICKFGISCIQREGLLVDHIISQNPILMSQKQNLYLVEQTVPNNVSSTLIRNCLAQNLSVKYLLPDSVIDYIKANGLFLP
eukprot:TRINITY_DN2714_c0_g1_i1.p1 TRINITY_DN2714_c0_g1~~TRINITY_DN2714_c0_g1_i1.p1  ORF type:complete len:233 (-),score=21.73 TRINITY_DN2714_c0_g1_i1:115-813(-)